MREDYGRYLEQAPEGQLSDVFRSWVTQTGGGDLPAFLAFLEGCSVTLGDVATEEEAWWLMGVWYEDPQDGFEALEGWSGWP